MATNSENKFVFLASFTSKDHLSAKETDVEMIGNGITVPKSNLLKQIQELVKVGESGAVMRKFGSSLFCLII